MSTYRNLPLCQPAPTTAPTVWSICSGGTSLARISSTSYWPGEGSGGSRRGNTCSPGTCDTAPYTWPYICSVVRFRSLKLLATIPPNPPQLAVIDHMNFASGKDVTALTTCSEALLVASSDASGEACMNRLMWLWSSIGASSRREFWYSGTAASMISTAAATIAQRIARAPSSSRSYRRRTASKPRCTSFESRPSRPFSFTKRELITGDRVTATTPETTTAAASVIANSRNREPVSPPWNPIGV